MKARMIFRLFSVFLTVSLLAGAGMVLPAARSSAMQVATQEPAPTATLDLGGITLQQVSYTATVLKPELVAQLVPLNVQSGTITAEDLSRTGGRMDFAGLTASQLPIATGTIMAAGISARTPYGLLRKVTDVRETSTGVTVQTAQATLEDAIENVDVSKDVSRLVASMQPATGHPAGGVLMMVAPSSAAGDIRILLKDQKLSDKVTANGEILIRPSFSMHMKIQGHRMEKFTFTDKTSIKANIKLTSGSSGRISLSTPLRHIVFASMNISPIQVFPIIITPVLDVSIGVNGQVFAGITMQGTYTGNGVLATDWEKGKWSFTKNFNDGFQYQPPAATANASAKIFARPCLSLMLYGVTGPYIQVEGYYRMELSPLKDPCWTVYGGIRGELGVKLEIFKFIQSISYTPEMFYHEKKIAQAGSKTSTPTWTSFPSSRLTSTAPPGSGRGSTPIPSLASTGGNVLILYDPTRVVLINTSPGSISLQGLTFRRIDSSGTETAGFTSDIWANYVPADKFKAFPSQDCVAVRTESKKEQLPCKAVWRFITSQTKYYFWMPAQGSSQFQVWQDDTLLQTCDIPAGSCSFSLPSS